MEHLFELFMFLLTATLGVTNLFFALLWVRREEFWSFMVNGGISVWMFFQSLFYFLVVIGVVAR